MLRRSIGFAISAYRKSPLHHPAIGSPLAKLLSWVQPDSHRKPFVHDLGDFKMMIDLEQHIDSKIYYTGYWEAEVVRTIRRLVRPGDTAVDIGANIGYLTLVLAHQTGAKGRVLSFEASDWSYRRLVENIGLNHFDWVNPEQFAVGDTAVSAIELRLPCGYRLDGRITATNQTVEVVTLDEYIAARHIDRVDFIKSDTDGMEANVIRGAQRTIARFRPTMIFELNPGDILAQSQTVDGLLNIFDELGYRFHRLETLAPFDNIREAAASIPEKDSVNVVALHRDRAA